MHKKYNMTSTKEVVFLVQAFHRHISLCFTGIQKLVLAGRVGEAVEATQQLYPGLLEHNPNLLFMLK